MSVVASSSARLRGKFRNRPEWAAEAKGLCAFTAATIYTAYIPTVRKSWLEGNAAIAKQRIIKRQSKTHQPGRLCNNILW